VAEAQRRAVFHLVLIKPSHHDDDGYPIQWLRSAIPPGIKNLECGCHFCRQRGGHLRDGNIVAIRAKQFAQH
jgi:hypothetical protein